MYEMNEWIIPHFGQAATVARWFVAQTPYISTTSSIYDSRTSKSNTSGAGGRGGHDSASLLSRGGTRDGCIGGGDGAAQPINAPSIRLAIHGQRCLSLGILLVLPDLVHLHGQR